MKIVGSNIRNIILGSKIINFNFEQSGTVDGDGEF